MIFFKVEKHGVFDVYNIFGIRFFHINKVRFNKYINIIDGFSSDICLLKRSMLYYKSNYKNNISNIYDKCDAFRKDLDSLSLNNDFVIDYINGFNVFNINKYPINCDYSVIKNGLLVYDYRGDDSYYNPGGRVNLGDYIQSIATRQFLPKVDKFISRDEISTYNDEPIKLIMNSWWWCCSGINDIPEQITPLFISYHLDNPENISPSIISYLKKYEPIGCRDMFTVRALTSYGIIAYFSACMTLTLGNKYKKNNSDESKILVCDYDVTENNCLNDFLKKHLKDAYNLDEFETCTNVCLSDTTTHNDRFYLANELLERYSSAKLVITSRLHCALPCLSIGIPVILMISKYDAKRYDGLIDFINYVTTNEQGNILSVIKRQNVTEEVVNDEKYTKYKYFLSNAASKFMNDDFS